MKPVDPRLLRYARTSRVFLAGSVLLGLVGAVLIVAQAVLIADVVVGGFQHGDGAGALRSDLLGLAGVAAGRALVAWLTELCAHRAGAAVKSQLRLRLLEHAGALGPGWLTGQRSGELTTLATRGVDALDDYFARYLPQLGLAVVVPVVVLARIVTADWVSAAIIVVTLPLIPLFMVLVGWATRERMDRQWALLGRLSGHFLDVVAGLPTLKVFGRAKAQADRIREITGDYRRATLRTLRIAFLSSFVLELLATIAVALVAVGIGMRLVHGELDLRTGLLVLILAPEAYLPLRQVGAQYHAAAEGLAAAEQVFEVLETAPRSAAGGRPAPDLRTATIQVEDLTVRQDGLLAATTFTLAAGETLAVTGPSGIGKSTLLSALLGFAPPAAGRILVDGTDLADLDPASWHRQIAWVPQRPHLFAGTIADNVRLSRPGATDAEVGAALAAAGAAAFAAAGDRIGEDGSGLSAGQRQRLALARAFLADRPLLLLDEPTAHLDGVTEAEVIAALSRLAASRTVVVTAHRPALLPLADRVLPLSSPTPSAVPVTPAAAAFPAQRVPAAAPPEPDISADASDSAVASVASVASNAVNDADEGAPTASPPGRRGRPTAGRVAGLIRGAGFWRRFAGAAALGVLALGCAVGLMGTSGWLISRASQHPPVLYLMVAVTATRTFGIGRAVFRYGERLVGHDAVLRALAEVRVAVFRRLERLAPAGLREVRRGDLLSRLVADVDGVQDYFLRWLLPAVIAGTTAAAAAAFTGWLLPTAGVILAAGLLAAGAAVPALAVAVARRTEGRVAPARGELSAQVLGLFTGTAELTVAGALTGRRRAAERADRTLTAITARSAATTALGAGLTALISGLTVTACAWAGVRAVAGHDLPGVTLAVVVLLPLAAFEAVNGMPLAAQQRQRSRRAAERVREVLDTPPPVTEPETPTEAPAAPYPLVIRGLTARHPGQDRPALAGVDLTLTPGRRIAVVGPSGAGKTTLAQVLLRFLDVEAGSYTLAGRDAAALAGDDVRRLVGLCAQDAHVFDSTVRENLRLARPAADDDELRAALAAARLDIDLDIAVGEHGARLSGGMRQRLALARALLARFPVLILDEPAEHLDIATADALTADLLAATRGRTTLIVTHRLAGLADGAVDEILVLAAGRVVQRGTYDELATADGPFRRTLEREREADAHPAVAGGRTAGLAA
ncbi:ATP-binding cassette, subfamily C, CydCD [Streptomyces sp. DvalAA-14]|uniref:thiol reductant ABC exporter subunit CydD n=1 Tax=unclassified Streptomyces TaxID=2593676 RepID=UPI00081B74BC|nr:thiol reductant ABC exporter subunit CydD [Streptomyces sp. DvalAA-14]MYS24953.1 thiol reductant ABC exporter subunit CydD [Streptomyces sp. SID4948]SCE50885.1 ATP-binding cassette, subfamily C, CydCD [Streptomyces sp. DvalAA-14]